VAASFSYAGTARPVVQRATTPMMGEMSTAIPFLKKPPALDGTLAGDVGFDPLGFTTTVTELGGDLKYVREAELMHGRVSMLAVVGFVFPSWVGKIPTEWTAAVSTDPITAQYQLPTEVYWQLWVTMAIAESLRARIIYTRGSEPDSVAGDHGFDPMGFLPKYCDTPEKLLVMNEKEIQHCRAAMIGITGFWFQRMITGEVWPVL